MIDELVAGRGALAGLWAERETVHMAVLGARRIEVLSLACLAGEFPSLARHHAPADRLERALVDLFGLTPIGPRDDRAWLDHGCWPLRHPLGAATVHDETVDFYQFLKAEGDGLHQVAVGPVHAGIIEPGHFRFSASGETLVRLEQRFGYTHKGIEALLIGASPAKAARLAGRVSGDSTVAYTLAFARAVEEASGISVPPRSVYLRALMAEIERIANHLGDIGGVCNDAAFAILHTHCALWRERVLRQADACFGHRLMMDRVIPGGVLVDLDQAGAEGLRALVANLEREFPALVSLFDETTSLQDRTVGTGKVSQALTRHYGAGGFVGRASGRGFDARRHMPYPPYDTLRFTVPRFDEGDVNARVWVRIQEVEQSLTLIHQILDQLPEGDIIAVDAAGMRDDSLTLGGFREGFALIEGFRGDILCWLRLGGDGRIERCHFRDPSWFQWPLLEAALEGNIIADFPICNKSFNCAYSGHDL